MNQSLKEAQRSYRKHEKNTGFDFCNEADRGKYIKKNKETHICHIDREKFFDKLERK